MSQGKGEFRVGTSGWQYDHWAEIFYPRGLPKSRWFEHYAQHFDTVEVNNTFYHLPQESTFDHWHDKAPRDFLYTLKFSRYGSHIKRLKDPADTIGLFMERAQRLEEFLGPILVQLAPQFAVDAERLEAFLSAAPRAQRWALEFRNPSWLCDEVYAVLRRHGAALCIHDQIDRHPRMVTADWVYLRYHRPSGGKYTPAHLRRQGQYVREYLAQGLDVFAYFNNDAHGYAVGNAADLRRLVAKKD
ncbi:MAG: DUF72 domain-containing protein [Planctomycetaceae bacterium]|nr:DUF72 domain-containing protein [Planctomycetaceae bacterium]